VPVLGFAKLSASPKRAQISECYYENQDADRQPDASVGQSEVDCVVCRGVVEEDAEDGAEGRREERRKPEREAHQQAGEQAQIA